MLTIADLSPAACETIARNALKAGDMRAVDAALHVLAVKDPHRAQELVDLMKVALAMSDAEETR